MVLTFAQPPDRGVAPVLQAVPPVYGGPKTQKGCGIVCGHGLPFFVVHLNQFPKTQG